MRRRRRALFRPSRRRTAIAANPLEHLLALRRLNGSRRGTPLEAITPPSPTASSSERTGSHLGIRLTLVSVVVAALFSVLLIRLWSIQVIQGSQLNSLAQATTTRQIEVQPPRGDIVASGGQVLAEDQAIEQVTISKNSIEQNPFVFGELAALLGVSVSSIQYVFNNDQFSSLTPIPVPTGPAGVTDADVLYIEHHANEFPGVSVTQGYLRDYPEKSLAAQMLGYVGQISEQELATTYKNTGYTSEVSVGQSGLEAEYELQLHGKPGVERVEVDPFDNIVSTESTTQPTRGDTLVLNMNLGLEEELSNAVASQVANVRAQDGGDGNGGVPTPAPWAAAVVLDAETGAVDAMTSYPSYNDNEWSGGISQSDYSELLNGYGQPLNDYAIDGLQPPGSTFKLTTATAALDDGLISPYSDIDDPGSFTLGNQTYYDTAESHGAGELDVSQALTVSNDIFFYQLGAWFWEDQQRYGEDAIQKVAEQYGLGSAPDIDLPDAASGQLDSPKLRIEQHAENPAAFPYNTYEPGDNVEMAFGQGETLVSPLQMAEAYATFANGGTRYAPEMASEIVAPSGKVVERIAPKVVGHVLLPSSTYNALYAGFEGVTQDPSGTAYDAFLGFPFTKWNVLGKTGTATTSTNPDVASTAWFVGFGGPVGAKPRYVVAIVVDQGGYGADAAAPVARDVFDYLDHHPIASTPSS